MAERNIEEDRRMAAFLQSKNYKGESWKTDEMLYKDWVKEGCPVEEEGFSVKGFGHSKKE